MILSMHELVWDVIFVGSLNIVPKLNNFNETKIFRCSAIYLKYIYIEIATEEYLFIIVGKFK